MPTDIAELMKQVRRIGILTSRAVDDYLSGAYHSVFKGQGIEFDEVRAYNLGDDIRAVDWNVTARMGHPYVKRFVEERELTVIFLVDISGSQSFGSRDRSKAEVSAEVACLLALSATRNQDRIGLILFSDRIEKAVPPRKGRRAAMRLAREILAAGETRNRTDIAAALRYLNNAHKRRAVVFLISDFDDADFLRELRVTSRRHDVICCPVSDPREGDLVPVGILEVEDPETGELALLDTASRSVRRAFARHTRREEAALRDRFRKLGIDSVFLSTARPYVDGIRNLFRRRQRRVGRAG
jgi:uncharacterized protein (DUF58 family)